MLNTLKVRLVVTYKDGACHNLMAGRKFSLPFLFLERLTNLSKIASALLDVSAAKDLK